MFIHDESNSELADLEATHGRVLCSSDGQSIAADLNDESEWDYPVTGDNDSLLADLMAQSYPTVTLSAPNEDYLELCYTVDAAELAYQALRGGRQAEPTLPRAGEHLCVRICAASGTAQTVVQRDDALPTPEEVQNNWQSVMAAIKQELENWVQSGCICRKKRKLARNIIDVRYVLKWKFEQDARSVQESQQAGPVATRRVIRARLTIRGFKVVDARMLDNYAGTSQRYSQRVLVSVAAQHR